MLTNTERLTIFYQTTKLARDLDISLTGWQLVRASQAIGNGIESDPAKVLRLVAPLQFANATFAPKD